MKYTFVAPAFICALSACSSSSGVDETVRNSLDVLNSGAALNAADSVVTLKKEKDKHAQVSRSGEMSIQKDTKSGGWSLTHNGETDVFSKFDTELEDYTLDKDGREVVFSALDVNLASNDGQVTSSQDILSKSKTYSKVIIFEDLDANENGVLEVGVVGVRTRPSDLSAIGTASYSGFYTSMSTVAASENDELNLYLAGDMSLDANFKNGKLSGVVTDLKSEGVAIKDAELVFSDTAVDNGAFSGVVTVNDAGQKLLKMTDEKFGTYNGHFYGPKAEEATGLVVIDATINTDAYDGVGRFVTKKK